MKKQDKIITLRIPDKLKSDFNEKSNKNNMTISARIKFLIMMDVSDRINIKNGKI
jgi:hypothetical protein